MGRIKTVLIKRVTHKLIKLHGEKFTENFDKNKVILNGLLKLPSKKIRNNIAGYLTRLVRKSKASD